MKVSSQKHLSAENVFLLGDQRAPSQNLQIPKGQTMQDTFAQI